MLSNFICVSIAEGTESFLLFIRRTDVTITEWLGKGGFGDVVNTNNPIQASYVFPVADFRNHFQRLSQLTAHKILL
jgi:hypothetical protein